jgi:hypothetical protein
VKKKRMPAISVEAEQPLLEMTLGRGPETIIPIRGATGYRMKIKL